MSTNKALFCLVFASLLLTAGVALGATDDSRYFVKTTSHFWQRSFQARNVFDGGFSADLSNQQLWLAKFFGISVEPVKKLNILATEVIEPAAPPAPVDRIPWGVRMMYGTSLAADDLPSGGDGVNVAVIDTGVDTNHPDLKARIRSCEDFSGVFALADGTCDDDNGHGTHVAGIIAADGGSDAKGIYGMAPGTGIFAYKACFSDGTCFADDVAAAIRYAVDNGANIVVLTAGSDTDIPLIDDAISYAAAKNAMVVAAAGNDGPYSGSLDYPAADPGTVSVGALDDIMSVPDWSARGLNSTDTEYTAEPGDIEFAAPGMNVESTWINGGYSTQSGTSMAAAHLAGLAAKYWQKDAENPAAATRDILHKFSQDILPHGDDDASGWGIPQL